jgi:hypothetical protein
MIKLQAAQRLLADAHWWDALDEEQQKEYLKEHPDSRYSEHPTTHGPSETPKHPETPGQSGEPVKPKPVTPETDPDKPETVPNKKPPKKDKDDSLIRHLLSKGGALKKKAKEKLGEGGKGALTRLIDPFEMTDVGKKGVLPKSPFKSKEEKIKDLQDKLSKLQKRKKGFGKNVPQNLLDDIAKLSEKLEKLQEE